MTDEGKYTLEEKLALDADEVLTLKVLAGDACLLRSERPIGQAMGDFVVPDSFFEPLPDDLLRLFNGEGPDDCEE